MIWDEDNIEKLKKLRSNGKTFGQIAEILGTTRNSVAGALRRHVDLRKDAPRVTPVKALPAKPGNAAPVGNAVLDLTHWQCRWPIGDPRTPQFKFCDGARAVGVPYCTTHMKLSYQPVRPRKKENRNDQARI